MPLKLKLGFVMDAQSLDRAGLWLDVITQDSAIKRVVILITPNSLAPSFDHYDPPRLYLRCLIAIEKWFLKRSGKYARSFHAYADPDQHRTPLFGKNIKDRRIAVQFLDGPLESQHLTLRGLDLDLLVLGPECPPSPELASLFPKGLIGISYQRGGEARSIWEAGLQEIVARESTIAFEIYRYAKHDALKEVLWFCRIPTAPFASLNPTRVQRKAYGLVKRSLVSMQHGNGHRTALPLSSTPPREASPLPATSTYLRAIIERQWLSALTKIQRLERVWSLGYQNQPDWCESSLKDFTPVPNPSGRFLADPFVFEREGKTICFAEDYDYAKRRGRITAFEITAQGCLELGIVLDEACHLSYPFLFEADGQLYMCPETLGINEIRLYRCEEFPLKWCYHATLIEHVQAVDTNIFEHEGRWWLMTSMDSGKMGDFDSELHLYYAERFDASNWIAHPMNPVIVDSEIARNGGFIKRDDALYRVRQRHGFSAYGAGISVSRIMHLDSARYDEEPIFNFDIEHVDKVLGVHTYTEAGDVRFVDTVSLQKRPR